MGQCQTHSNMTWEHLQSSMVEKKADMLHCDQSINDKYSWQQRTQHRLEIEL